MKSSHFVVIGAAVIVLLAIPATAPAETVTARQLLDRYEQLLQSFKRQTTTGETIVRVEDSAAADAPLWDKYVTELRYDGDTKRYDALRSSWLGSNDGSFGQAAPPRKSRQLWDGKAFYSSWFFEGDDPSNIIGNRVAVSMPKSPQERQTDISAYYSAPLNGILRGDKLPLPEILRQTDKLSLREQREIIEGSPCYVIEAAGKHGEYTIWVDPQHDYNIARAQVHKKLGDLAWGVPLTNKGVPVSEKMSPSGKLPWRTEYSFCLEKVIFQKVGGKWVPMEAHMSSESKFSDGRQVKSSAHHKRTHVDFDPDFAAAGAFDVKLPNDTIIYLLEAPGIKYRWRDGGFVTDVDRLVMTSLDEMVRQQKDDPEARLADESPTAETTSTADLPDDKPSTPLKHTLSPGIMKARRQTPVLTALALHPLTVVLSLLIIVVLARSTFFKFCSTRQR